jgi:hypothetical protein
MGALRSCTRLHPRNNSPQNCSGLDHSDVSIRIVIGGGVRIRHGAFDGIRRAFVDRFDSCCPLRSSRRPTTRDVAKLNIVERTYDLHDPASGRRTCPKTPNFRSGRRARAEKSGIKTEVRTIFLSLESEFAKHVFG